MVIARCFLSQPTIDRALKYIFLSKYLISEVTSTERIIDKSQITDSLSRLTHRDRHRKKNKKADYVNLIESTKQNRFGLIEIQFSKVSSQILSLTTSTSF